MTKRELALERLLLVARETAKGPCWDVNLEPLHEAVVAVEEATREEDGEVLA